MLLLSLVVVGVGAGFFALARQQSASPPPAYWDAPEFALLDQTGDTLRSAELRGAPWVASFIFTNCTGVCPLISTRMAELRDSLAAAGLLGGDVRLVSFSVDPARDSPDVLRDYAERYGGSPPDEWAFLTGSPPDAVLSMIQDGFRLSAVGPSDAVADTASNYQVNHSPRIVLVDSDGVVRGLYRGPEPAAVDSALAGVRALIP